MRSGETVLVTAAAGGLGQFVVQLAKQAGNTVIATCGTNDKARLLRRLGADRVINYRKESLKEVLKKEYPTASSLQTNSFSFLCFCASLTSSMTCSVLGSWHWALHGVASQS